MAHLSFLSDLIKRLTFSWGCGMVIAGSFPKGGSGMEFRELNTVVIQKVCAVTTMYSEQGRSSQRKNRDRWGIAIKYEGETQYQNQGQNYRSDKNHLVILPKGCDYEWVCLQAGHFCMLEFEAEQTCDRIFSFPVRNSDGILKIFKELEYKRTLRFSNVELESLRETYEILLRLLESGQKRYLPANKQEKIQPALDFLAQNYAQSVRNEQLAALTSLSTVYFRKLFTEVCGMSPIVYLHELRIQKAQEMLQSDFGSMGEIAQSLGYLNIYDFSRTFKKHTGVSPSNFLKAQRRK